jgi:hypothetical protein
MWRRRVDSDRSRWQLAGSLHPTKAETKTGFVSALLAGLIAVSPSARAQASGAVSVSVDATAAGIPLARVWSFHGYDEINYTPPGRGQGAARNPRRGTQRPGARA